MANTSVQNKISSIEENERFKELQNEMNEVEQRVTKMCEDLYFEIIVEPQEEGSNIIRFVIDPKNIEYDESSDEAAEKNSNHPFKIQIHRLKKMQKHYNFVKGIANSTFEEIKEKYKHTNNVFKLLDRKLQPEQDLTFAPESAMLTDADSTSDFEFLKLNIDYQQKITPKSEDESGWETQTASECESDVNMETDTDSDESDIETTKQFDVEHVQQLQQLVSDLNLERIISGSRYQTMIWKGIIRCTKELLAIVFGNEMLATHTLFHRPGTEENWEICTESQLNPYKTAYVIKVVCSKHNVSTSDVRTIIGTLCADAAKKYQKK